ncbi:YjbQ family protein [Methanoculleus bourgensis]
MFRTTIQVETHGEGEIVNLTPRIEQAITASGVREGLASIFVTGSTAAITTIEYERCALRPPSGALGHRPGRYPLRS